MDHKDKRIEFTEQEAALMDGERSYPEWDVLKLGHRAVELVAVREDIIAELRMSAAHSQKGRIIGLATEINDLYKLQRDLDKVARAVHPELFTGPEL